MACTWPSFVNFKALQVVLRYGQGGEPLLQGSLRLADKNANTNLETTALLSCLSHLSPSVPQL